MRRRAVSDGFTIVELLIVCAIVIVLSSLLFPLIGSVLRNAKAATCVSNEKQLLAASFAFAADKGGRVPNASQYWAGDQGSASFTVGEIWPYLSSSTQTRQTVVHCPADTLEQYCTYVGNLNYAAPDYSVIPPPYRNFSYSINISVNTGGPYGILLSQVKNPSEHVLVYEEFAPNDSSCYGPGDPDDWLTGRHGGPGTIEHRAAYNNTAWTFDGRGNVGYFDGHVGTMTVNTYFNTSYHFGPLNQ